MMMMMITKKNYDDEVLVGDELTLLLEEYAL